MFAHVVRFDSPNNVFVGNVDRSRKVARSEFLGCSHIDDQRRLVERSNRCGLGRRLGRVHGTHSQRNERSDDPSHSG